MSSSNGSATGTGFPCGACKFLRRKCAANCVFAPYFSSDHGPARFAAIHKVFGASNASKMLMHVPVVNRHEAVMTIMYEAQARIRDPVYGCTAHIFMLQQQVVSLQAQLMQANAQLAQNVANNVWNMEGHYSFGNSPSPKSSLESIDRHSFGDVVPCTGGDGDENISMLQRNYISDTNNNCYLGELHDLAFRMMRN